MFTLTESSCGMRRSKCEALPVNVFVAFREITRMELCFSLLKSARLQSNLLVLRVEAELKAFRNQIELNSSSKTNVGTALY